MIRLVLLLCLLCVSMLRAEPLLPAHAKRILVLGDSITHKGGYVAGLETWFLRYEPVAGRVWVNLGLPSENVSGVSEPGHAGGTVTVTTAADQSGVPTGSTRKVFSVVTTGSARKFLRLTATLAP
jgi:hypothetical protein